MRAPFFNYNNIKMTMNALKIILPVACLLSFSTYSFAELDEEIVTSVDASAYVVESDNPFDSLDDHEKIRHPQYIPEQDSLRDPLLNARYYVIAGKSPIHYYAIRTGQKPKLLYLNQPHSAVFSIGEAYAENREKITLQPQLDNTVKDHELFSIMPVAKNLALIFRTRYAYTPTELKANAAMNAIYANNRYRYSYEIIEIDTNGKQLHRVQFVAPTIEDGMSFGPKWDEDLLDYNNVILEYSTKSPGDYQTVHPYNLETRYEYKQGQLKHFEQRILLTASDKVFLKNSPNSINYENYLDDQDVPLSVESSTCLDDYFVFKDKAAPLGVKWGNDWMQQQPKLHQQFLAEYAQGKNYVWKDFRVRYCDLD